MSRHHHVLHPRNDPFLTPTITQRRSFFASRELRAIIPYALADIGEGITECEIVQWFVKHGDRIQQFDKICEVQSDKASVEITSRYDGTIMKLYYDVGAMARVGKALVDIDTGNGDASQTSDTSAPSATSPAQLQSTPTTPTPTTSPDESSSGSNSEQYILTTPAVRRLAKEQNIDLTKVRGTGKDGRISKEDIVAFQDSAPQREAIQKLQANHVATITTPLIASKAQPIQPRPSPQPKAAASPGDTVPLSSIQRAMFKNMTKSISIPHFGYSDEIDLTQVSILRANINSFLSNHNDITHKQPVVKKISYMPIFLKAMSMALKEFPIMNASLIDGDASTVKLKYNTAHNIGVAMDTPGGLIVPNIKNIESKSMISIADELDRLKDAGRRNALSPSDMSGGTITLSNIGNIGGTLLHPIIPPNDLCIGAVGRIQRLPRIVEVNGEERFVAKDIIHVSFNADHRVIDGATMARFVSLFKAYLETPGRLMVEMQ